MRLEPERHHNQRPNHRDVTHHLLLTARRLATKAGIDSHRREDYAAQFAEKMLCERHHDLLRYCQGNLSENWLRQCARNALLNYLRDEASIRRHETAWPQTEDDNGHPIDVDFVGLEPALHITVIRQELRRRIEAVIDLLEPEIGDLFRQRFLVGKTIIELAEAAGSDPDALRKRLKRACERVRSQLQRWGIDAEEVNEYLVEIIDSSHNLSGSSDAGSPCETARS